MALVLVLLLVVTMLGTTALRTARIEEQLAGATYERTIARAAGDAAMADAFRFVYAPSFSPTAVPLLAASATEDGWTIESLRRLNVDWYGSSANLLGAGGLVAAPIEHVYANPSYIVDRLPPEITQSANAEHPIRVTVRAIGGRAVTEQYSTNLILVPFK